MYTHAKVTGKLHKSLINRKHAQNFTLGSPARDRYYVYTYVYNKCSGYGPTTSHGR